MGCTPVRLVVLVDEQTEIGQHEVAFDQAAMLDVELGDEAVKNDPVTLLETGPALVLLLREVVVGVTPLVFLALFGHHYG